MLLFPRDLITDNISTQTLLFSGSSGEAVCMANSHCVDRSLPPGYNCICNDGYTETYTQVSEGTELRCEREYWASVAMQRISAKHKLYQHRHKKIYYLGCHYIFQILD